MADAGSWNVPSSALTALASEGWPSQATMRALIGLPSGSSTSPSAGVPVSSRTRTTSSTGSSRRGSATRADLYPRATATSEVTP